MNKSENKKTQQIYILVIQCFLVAIPCGLSALLFIFNPSYLFRLIEPGPQQPIGWCFAAILFLVFGLLLGLSWKIAFGWKIHKTIANIIFMVIFLALDCLFCLALLLSPAVLLILTSPVGKMFFHWEQTCQHPQFSTNPKQTKLGSCSSEGEINPLHDNRRHSHPESG